MAFDLMYLILHFIGCNGTCSPMLAVLGPVHGLAVRFFPMWHGLSDFPCGCSISWPNAVQDAKPVPLCNAGFLRIGAT